jgi:cytochrome c oxidase cbb3-type subunit 2
MFRNMRASYLMGAVMMLVIFTVAIITTIALPFIDMAAQDATPRAIQEWKDTGRATWNIDNGLVMGSSAPTMIGRGRAVFIREGCFYCHTQLPEQTKDWEYFGAPPVTGDYKGQWPAAVGGNEREGPDLFHVGSRIPSVAYHLLHHAHPRALIPASVMPDFDYLSRIDLQAVAQYVVSLK